MEADRAVICRRRICNLFDEHGALEQVAKPATARFRRHLRALEARQGDSELTDRESMNGDSRS
jgi:hypothetical protein